MKNKQYTKEEIERDFNRIYNYSKNIVKRRFEYYKSI